MELIRPTDQELDSASGNFGCTGAQLWATIEAARAGDEAALKTLLASQPSLARAEYWYTGPLHFAVREGHVGAVNILLEHGADPTAIRYGGEELTTVARDRGHEEAAQIIETARGAVLQNHAVHEAAKNGDVQKLDDLLLADQRLVHQRDAQGATPLHLAIPGGRVEVLELLLEAGADIEAVHGTGGTYSPAGFKPIDLAIWNSDFWINARDDWKIAEFLLDNGADYSITIAAALGDTAQVREFLGDDPALANAAQPCGKRPLSAAAERGHDEIVRLLLQNGANPNLPEGRYAPRGSALHAAARRHDHGMVRLLLEHGADPNSGIDSCGNVWHVSDADTKRLLYRHGLRGPEVDCENIDALVIWADKDPQSLARAGCGTVFTMVVKNEWGELSFTDDKKLDVLMILLQRGVRVPPVVTGCRSYLWHKPHLTRILLEHGMDPNLPDFRRATPLHDVCGRGGRGEPVPHRLELAELFLEFGADINAHDEEYRSTPLGWAARCGLRDMVEFLLHRGAAVQLPDDEPWATPLAWAVKRGHVEIEKLLMEHSATPGL